MPSDEPLTRARVVACARTAIEARGSEGLSLRAVARDLGVTAPALYAYVDGKDDLVAAVATQYFDELVTRFEAVDTSDPIAGIRALSRAYVDHALASPPLFRLLFRYPPASTGVAVPDVASFAPATRAFEVALVTTTRAIDDGLLAEADPVAAAMTMWAAVHGVAEVLLLGFGFDEAAADALISSVIGTVLAGQVNTVHPAVESV
ncbi:MAG TPA: TetR/AcrR family transcriptional regulator [Acidimicrobiales bacterium]|nr:TetR/AcrR family transcriptional regulator [Acidimicrobiales bacterium]